MSRTKFQHTFTLFFAAQIDSNHLFTMNGRTDWLTEWLLLTTNDEDWMRPELRLDCGWLPLSFFPSWEQRVVVVVALLFYIYFYYCLTKILLITIKQSTIFHRLGAQLLGWLTGWTVFWLLICFSVLFLALALLLQMKMKLFITICLQQKRFIHKWKLH